MRTPPTLSDYAVFGCRRSIGPAIRPTISLVTICLNAGRSIGRTIASVHSQHLPPGTAAEHVIVDGGSTDGSLEFIKALLRPTDYLISEPDRGISDALNKGVALARGRYIQFIHADDWLADGQLAVSLAAAAGDKEADFVFGDVLFHERDETSFLYKGEPNYAKVIDRRMPNLNHPTVLAKRDCFEKIGLFDPAYRCAMDYDWFLRLHRAGGRGLYVPEIRGNMSHDGVSNVRFVRTQREVAEIARKSGRHAVPATVGLLFQVGKVALGHAIKRHAAPIYRLIRRRINSSYEPINTSKTTR